MENFNRFLSLIENSGTFIEVWRDTLNNIDLMEIYETL